MYSFSYWEPVCCSMSSSNCCFLTCIHISQEAGQVVWYSHIFQNFPQFIVIHTVEGFGIVNKAENRCFSGTLCFFNDPVDIGNLISGSSAFSKTSLNIWKFTVQLLLKSGSTLNSPATAAIAKSLQLCLTLCNPIPGILQTRTREWVAISFSNA